MKHFKEFSKKDKQYILSNDLEPYIKGAIIKLSHDMLNSEQFIPMGIFKYEGGVVLEQKEFVIKSNFVAFDWRYERCELPELEQTIVDAILKVKKVFRKPDFKSTFEPCWCGDPLRSLLEL